MPKFLEIILKENLNECLKNNLCYPQKFFLKVICSPFDSFKIPFWTQTSTEFYFADKNGTQTALSDTRQYRSAISIEYPDGSLGEPITWTGNTTPTDEIPNPPDWIKAPKDCGNIIFSSPNSFETSREIDSYNMDFKKKICYFHSYFFPPIEGRIIVFPSHLEHHVDFNKSNEDRISVSFNIRLSDEN